MPNINMTGGYKYGVGTSSTYDLVKNNNGPKTATAMPPGTTTFHQVSDQYFSGGSGAGTAALYEIFRAVLAFDCTAITEAPSSAVLHLSSKTGTGNYTLTNAASDHKLILLGAATGTGQMGEPGTFFDSNGANALSSTSSIRPGFNDMAGWGNGNVDSAVTKLSDPFNQSLFNVSSDGDDVAITLNATGRAAMASLDILIIYITDYTWQVQGGDPQADTPSAGSAANTEVQFSASTAGVYTLPFITYEESVDFPNAENESGALVGGDFTINTFSSAVLGAQFAQAGEQVPFSLGTPGVRHLRGRLTAYSTEKGEKVSDKEGRGKKGKSKR